VASTLKLWLDRVALLAPHGLWLLNQRLRAIHRARSLPWNLLQANARLKDSQRGGRCFIVGNGPSVAGLDLSLLKGENIFSVSNGYLHPSFACYQPRFHCVPQITYGKMTEADAVAWFIEMHAHLGDAILFLSTTEAKLVEQYGLFQGRLVHYLALQNDFEAHSQTSAVDLSKPLPRVESVPVMAIMIAMYLGFNEIYLLGVDHDHFKTGVYGYPFELKVQRDKDLSVASDGKILINRHDDFHSLARLWSQYRALKQIAWSSGIQIFNATPGGELDEFPRKSFNTLFGDIS